MSRRYACTACPFVAGTLRNPLTYLRAAVHLLRGCP
jgi:hypothetical protein